MFFLILLFILLCLLITAAFVIFRTTLYTPNRTQNEDHRLFSSAQMDVFREQIFSMIDAFNARPYESVQILSEDGLKLYGKYYHRADGAPLAICFHGYRGTPARDFSGGSKIYLEHGFNLLMVEQRGHKRSEGHRITLGVKERFDCLAWARYAERRFGEKTPLILCGISMGAATVLMASSLDLPKNVCGIIADCPYTSPKEIMLKVARGMGFGPRFIYPFLWLAAKLFAGFDPAAADCCEAVRHTDLPILLIHGEADRFVPCDMSRKIAAAAPDHIELHTFPDAGHGISFLLDPERYRKIVLEFLDRVIES